MYIYIAINIQNLPATTRTNCAKPIISISLSGQHAHSANLFSFFSLTKSLSMLLCHQYMAFFFLCIHNINLLPFVWFYVLRNITGSNTNLTNTNNIVDRLAAYYLDLFSVMFCILQSILICFRTCFEFFPINVSFVFENYSIIINNNVVNF